MNYRGIRIKKMHQQIYRLYLFLMALPFLAGIGYFCYLKIYPKMQVMQARKVFDYREILVPSVMASLMIVLVFTVLLLLRRVSKIRGTFFLRVLHRQMLARMLVSRNLYDRKMKKTSDGKLREVIHLPPTYYKQNGHTTELTFATDGSRYHEQFLRIGPVLEQMYVADIIDVTREIGRTTYTLLIGSGTNRITINEVTVSGSAIRLMRDLWWNFDAVPHMLIAGGTGGGKSYFLLTLVEALIKVGTLDICDPKKADLEDLKELPAFKGHVFSGTKWITYCLQKAVEEMEQRYVYMKSLPNYTTGKNYAYYQIPPHFIVIDEWVAFASTLDFKEKEAVMRLVQRLILEARQAGIFLIMAMQRPDAEYLGGGIRDNMMMKITLGKLQPVGYRMMYGDEAENKNFYNNEVRGRGYENESAGVPREFYSPLVPKEHNFMESLATYTEMITQDFSMIAVTKEEHQQLEKELSASDR